MSAAPAAAVPERVFSTDSFEHGRQFPSVVTILPTYRCNAACRNCCFDSNPAVQGRIPQDRLLGYVDEAASLGTVRLLVISGGEPFLLGPDLDEAVARAHERGLRTRVVSNAFWAGTLEKAQARLAKLPGLDELNVSTGDFHVEWVPLERVVHAARAAVDRGLKVVVMVERQAERKVFADDVKSHPLIREVLDDLERCALLDVVESPWMQRGASSYGHGALGRRVEAGEPVAQEAQVLLSRENLKAHRGCVSVLNTLTVTPYERLGACCGLPREEIPELNIGSLRETGLQACYDDARNDFLKIWLAVEGPEQILAWAGEHDPTIEWEHRYGHQCDACRAVYKDPKVKAVVRRHFREKVPDVLLRWASLDRTSAVGEQG